jgi:hypothetical protein
LAVAFGAVEAQDPGGFRWSLSTGPTMSLTGRGLVCASELTCTSSNLITGAHNGRHHFGVGVSRSISGTALVVRADALYNVSVSGANSWTMTGSRFAARNALRDEWYSLGLGLQWDALPAKPWSPYLLTSAGMAFNRIGWNESDVMSTAIDRSQDQIGIFGALGAGMRVRVSGVELFSEVRRHYSPTLNGSRPMPFSFGIRF